LALSFSLLAFGRGGSLRSRALFFVADDPRPVENRTISIQSAIFVRLILSTHTMQAPLLAEDEYLHA
jgi:hypothetical protein